MTITIQGIPVSITQDLAIECPVASLKSLLLVLRKQFQEFEAWSQDPQLDLSFARYVISKVGGTIDMKQEMKSRWTDKYVEGRVY